MGPDGRDGHTRRECTNASEFSVHKASIIGDTYIL